MKILIIGPYGNGLLPYSYARSFESIGHEVLWFDSLREYLQSAHYRSNLVLRRMRRHKLWESLNVKVIEVVEAAKPDMVLAFKAAFLHPATIRKIRVQKETPILNYYPDNPYCGVPLTPHRTSAQRRDLIDCLREYTQVFVWSRQLSRRLKYDGVISVYLPFGMDSFTFNPKPADVDRAFMKNYDVVFIGQRNKKRDRHLSAIRNHRITIWGPLWEKASKNILDRHVVQKERAFGKDCASIYINAGVALNIVDDLNMPGHNMRTFEIPACGGVMISTFTEEQAAFFPDGEAAFYYRDPQELDDIIERLLSDNHKRRRVSQNALTIAADHTYIKRAEKLLDIYSKEAS